MRLSDRHTSECHRCLIRTGVGASLAYLIRVGVMATAAGGVSVETVVFRRGDHHAVAVNVDLRRDSPRSRRGPPCADPIL